MSVVAVAFCMIVGGAALAVWSILNRGGLETLPWTVGGVFLGSGITVGGLVLAIYQAIS